MKWSGETSIRSCVLFAALMLAAVVTTCVMVIWVLYPGAGVLTLARNTFSGEAVSPNDQLQDQAAIERPAPDFTLTDLSGNQVSLRHFSGQPVVINFWATWCPPCRVEIPHLVEAYERERAEVVFLAISVDEPASTVRRFAEKNDMSLIILLDDAGKVASAYDVKGIPVTFFIGRDGEIVARYVGQMSPRRIQEGLSRIK